MFNKLEACTFQSAVNEFLLIILVQISVGHAMHDSGKKLVEVDRELGTQKVFFCKTAPYERVLEKSRSKVFPEGPKEAKFYIAEANGVQIDGDDIILDNPSGGEWKLPCTLAVYLKASGVSYQSRARSAEAKKYVSVYVN